MWKVSPYVTPGSQIGIVSNGTVSANVSSTERIDLITEGNASTFGNLLLIGSFSSACASPLRGITAVGGDVSISNALNYYVFNSACNGVDFGDLTSARQSCGSVSSTTRGIFAGGSTGSSNVVTSDYITIASVGNASNFGSLSVARQQSAGCSSPIIGLICGGYASGAVNVIDYFTITTLGDALDFGDLTAIRNGGGCCSSPTRGIYAGGQNGSTAQTNIDIFGLVTTSTATNFGNLSTGTFGLHACSSHVKGTLIGGYDTANLASMQALNFATAGVLSTFGNLITARRFGAACSNSHGGLA